MNNRTERPAAGLIYGPDAHHIDHIAPLCQLMGAPLICTEEEIALKANQYYPDLEVIHSNYIAVADELVSRCEVLFYSIPRALFDEIFFFAQKLRQKKIHTIWCPHGNSDKGRQTPFMEALGKEEIALVYGPRMIDFMKEKGVFNNLKTHIVTGNYRYQFYLEHQAFYDTLIENEILRRLPPLEKTLLYAPTWQDREKSSSFYAALPFLVKTLPESWNLIVKPHPNLRLQDEFGFERLLDTYRDHPRVLFLEDFPPIYPLLNIADIYIGDYSSIGYDFLTFKRPLFFLNQRDKDAEKDPGLYLYRCGTCINPSEYPQIYQKIADFESFELRDFAKIQSQVYDQTFGPTKNLEQLRKEIKQSYSLFPESDWNFF